MDTLWLVVLFQSLLSAFCIMMFHQWLDARWSGWMHLARLYRAAVEPSGRRFESVTFSMNARCYRGVGTVVVNSAGLYLELVPSLRFLHPPLMVPWKNIEEITAGPLMELELAAPFAVRLRLTEPALHEAIRQLELHSHDRSPAPRRPAA